MTLSLLTAVVGMLAAAGFYLGRARALGLARTGGVRLHSLPGYYGYYVASWCGVPALVLLVIWLAFEPRVIEPLVLSRLPAETQQMAPAKLELVFNDIRNLALGNIASRDADAEMRAAADHYLALRRVGSFAVTAVVLAAAVAGLAFARANVMPQMRARPAVERAIRVFLAVCSILAILTTVGIVLSLLFESIRFFRLVAPAEFLFGLEWSPQMALRADQVGSSGAFGAVPLFAGTALISMIAMAVAAPIGLFAAVYMAEYAPPGARAVLKPTLEVLAGIPTVVYGFFAALMVAPFLQGLGGDIGLTISSESALAAGLVMGIMIIPFVSSISDDVISAVPSAMRDGSLAIGATRSETIRRVVIPAALPGIVGGLLLAVSRAIGETMIVVMAAGLAANLTANPFEAVTTVTVQIVSLLIGDQEFDSAKTLAAFALGLTLFFITLTLNVIALTVVRRYREQYE